MSQESAPQAAAPVAPATAKEAAPQQTGRSVLGTLGWVSLGAAIGAATVVAYRWWKS